MGPPKPPMGPKATEFGEITQNHRYGYQSRAHMRLSISD